MDPKWIQILVILAFYQKMTSGADVIPVVEGAQHEIKCRPVDATGMIIWFRVVDKAGMEFIVSYSSTGILKSEGALYDRFDKAKSQKDKLVLKSFGKASDSGVYSCGCIKGNTMVFGEVHRLAGDKVPDPVTVPAPQEAATKPCPSTTTRPCLCPTQENSSLRCPPIILGPLAGGCGLLLLLLIVTTLYCNKIRTRRCPHHYKKRPRPMAPEKMMMTNRHV